MKGYEPFEVKPFNKVSAPLEGDGTQIVHLKLIDNPPPRNQNLWDKIAENEELDYLIRSSQRIIKGTTIVENSLSKTIT